MPTAPKIAVPSDKDLKVYSVYPCKCCGAQVFKDYEDSIRDASGLYGPHCCKGTGAAALNVTGSYACRTCGRLVYRDREDLIRCADDMTKHTCDIKARATK